MIDVLTNAIEHAVTVLNVDMPAFIKTYDPATQTATVYLGALEPDGKGGYLERIEIPDVKVRVMATDSKTYLHLPLKEGTGGNLKWVDCDIEGYRRGNGTPQQVIDEERHDAKDLYFVPGFFPDKDALDDADDENVTLRNDKMKITLDPDGKISIEGSSDELVDLISSGIEKTIDAVKYLETAVYAVNAGAATAVMNPASVTQLEAYLTSLNNVKTKIDGMKI